jgi:hypothetical protein
MVNKTLYEAKEPSVKVDINDADVLTVLDLEGTPIYILELKVTRKD